MNNFVAKHDFNRASTHQDKRFSTTRQSSGNLMDEALDELEEQTALYDELETEAELRWEEENYHLFCFDVEED